MILTSKVEILYISEKNKESHKRISQWARSSNFILILITFMAAL